MKVLFYYNGGEHIGIEYLSAYLKEKGHEVDLVFDPGLGNNFYVNLPILDNIINDKLIIRKAQKFNPDIIAISCITNLYPAVKRIASKFKTKLNCPIIIGGIHPTSLPDKVIKEDWVDFLCIGEGEEAFAELLEKMKKGEDVSNIKNLWVKDANGKITKNPLRPLITDLDSLPFPDKSLFHQMVQ